MPLQKGEAKPAAETGQPQFLEAPRQGKADDLTVIHGIGRAVEAILNGLGVFHYDQISGWSDDESRWIEQAIGFPGRIGRENWRGQAARFVSASAKGRTRKAEKPKSSRQSRNEADEKDAKDPKLNISGKDVLVVRFRHLHPSDTGAEQISELKRPLVTLCI